MTIVKAAGIVNLNKICNNYFNEIKEGRENISVKTPKASDYLNKYIDAKVIPQIQADKYNYNNACIKTGLNKQIDYDYLVNYCKCTANVYFNVMTKSEFNEFTTVANNGGDVKQLPQFAKIKPFLESCSQK